MKDPLEFDSETIFKLEQINANCQRKIKELESKLSEYKRSCIEWQKCAKDKNSKLIIAMEFIYMVEDHRKMPHQHSDAQTKLYCLTERARETMEKIK